MFYQHTVDNLDNRGVGEVGVAPAIEHAGTAGLEAEREDIEGHVGTRLVDNSYHAERYRHLANGHAVGALPLPEHLAHGVGQLGDLAEAEGHVGDALLIQHEAVEHILAHAVRPLAGHIGPVRGEHLGAARLQRVRHGEQGGVLLFRGQLCGGGCCGLGRGGALKQGLHSLTSCSICA